MTLRRVVALALLLSVSFSSVEVLFGLESSLGAAQTLPSLQVQADVVPGPPASDTADCPCLCACLCAGAQLVAVPTAPSSPTVVAIYERYATEAFGSLTVPSPLPLLRPPVA